MHLGIRGREWAPEKLGEWGREIGPRRVLTIHSHLTPTTLLLQTSATARRLLRRAALEQCQQKHLAPVHRILGSSSARPWKSHVALISQRVGRGSVKEKKMGVCMTVAPKRGLGVGHRDAMGHYSETRKPGSQARPRLYVRSKSRGAGAKFPLQSCVLSPSSACALSSLP